MQTGFLTQQYGITRDTLRFYIKEGLLQPSLENGKYSWSEEDVADLEQILALRDLGLSIKSIQRIKTLHETQCGTMAQWTENRQILLDDLADKEAQMAALSLQIQQVKGLLQTVEEKIGQNEKLTD